MLFGGKRHVSGVEFAACLTARRDALVELVDAVLCEDGAVKSRWLDVVARASAWARSDVERLERQPARRRQAADGAGRPAAAAIRRWASGPSGRRVAMASLGRAVLGGTPVLPPLRPGEDGVAVHTGPALLLRGRARARRHVLDPDPGRGPARPNGRRDRG